VAPKGLVVKIGFSTAKLILFLDASNRKQSLGFFAVRKLGAIFFSALKQNLPNLEEGS
jgi:hypothetical protein